MGNGVGVDGAFALAVDSTDLPLKAKMFALD